MQIPPAREPELLEWSQNLYDKVTAADASTLYGLTSEQFIPFASAQETFKAAYAVTNDPDTKTKPAVQTKNTAKKSMLDEARKLISQLQGSSVMTDAKRDALQIPIKDSEPTPVPPPSEAPTLEILSQNGHEVTFRLLPASGPSRRRKPEGVQGATVLTYVGDTAPLDPTVWTFQGNTTKNVKTIVFDESIAPGTKVWLTAFWFNRRTQSGPPCDPVAAYIQFGGMRRAA
ncbi:MAG: hypothetical protein AAGF84_09420 [Planctomycetota bacterium]